MRAIRRRAAALVAVAASLLIFSATAMAADPDAPAGAPAIWLPSTPWVLDHWLPYNETRLYQLLHTDRDGVLHWLGSHNDKASLNQFARVQGVSTTGLADKLVGPKPAWMSDSLHRTLVSRAELTLTQPHLAHHIFGHLMHVLVLQVSVPQIFHASLQEASDLHQQGYTYAEIGAREGITQDQLRTRIMNVLSATQAEAVRTHQTPAAQAKLWLTLQQNNLKSWLNIANAALSDSNGPSSQSVALPSTDSRTAPPGFQAAVNQFLHIFT